MLLGEEVSEFVEQCYKKFLVVKAVETLIQKDFPSATGLWTERCCPTKILDCYW